MSVNFKSIKRSAFFFSTSVKRDICFRPPFDSHFTEILKIIAHRPDAKWNVYTTNWKIVQLNSKYIHTVNVYRNGAGPCMAYDKYTVNCWIDLCHISFSIIYRHRLIIMHSVLRMEWMTVTLFYGNFTNTFSLSTNIYVYEVELSKRLIDLVFF